MEVRTSETRHRGTSLSVEEGGRARLPLQMLIGLEVCPLIMCIQGNYCPPIGVGIDIWRKGSKPLLDVRDPDLRDSCSPASPPRELLLPTSFKFVLDWWRISQPRI